VSAEYLKHVTRTGDVIEYDADFDLRDDLIKHFVWEFMVGGELITTGFHAWIHQDDAADYDADAYDDRPRLAVCNQMMGPEMPYGAVFPYFLRGEQAPALPWDTLVGDGGERLQIHPNVPEPKEPS
jgi:hypothetical protein